MLEPTELGKLFNLSGSKMNKTLESLGLQARINNGWVVTDVGSSHAQKHSWVKNGKSGYNYKWNVSVIKDLINKTL